MELKKKIISSEPMFGYKSSGEPNGPSIPNEIEYDNVEYASKLVNLYNQSKLKIQKIIFMKLICKAIGEQFDENDLPDKLPNNFPTRRKL